MIFKHPQVSVPGFDTKGKRTHLQNLDQNPGDAGMYLPSSSGVESLPRFPSIAPGPSSVLFYDQAVSVPSGSNTNFPLYDYRQSLLKYQLMSKQIPRDADQVILHQLPQQRIAPLVLSDMVQADDTIFQILKQTIESWPSNELGSDNTLSDEKEPRGHPTIRNTIN